MNIMKNKVKQVGLWLDHAMAHVIGYRDGYSYLIETVESPYNRKPRVAGEGSDITRFGVTYISNNEDRKHNRLRNKLESYFTVLENKLKDYDEILLFGPTNAKNQLYNRLTQKKAFAGKTILMESAGTLTENQTIAFVRDFYNAASEK